MHISYQLLRPSLPCLRIVLHLSSLTSLLLPLSAPAARIIDFLSLVPRPSSQLSFPRVMTLETAALRVEEFMTNRAPADIRNKHEELKAHKEFYTVLLFILCATHECSSRRPPDEAGACEMQAMCRTIDRCHRAHSEGRILVCPCTGRITVANSDDEAAVRGQVCSSSARTSATGQAARESQSSDGRSLLADFCFLVLISFLVLTVSISRSVRPSIEHIATLTRNLSLQ